MGRFYKMRYLTKWKLIAVVLLFVLLSVMIYLRYGLNCKIKNHEMALDLTATGILNDFNTEEDRNLLLRHLCASAEWKVTDEYGAIVANQIT